MKTTNILISLTALLCLTACGASERLKNVGKVPEVTPIGNPAERAGVQTVSMPMPPIEVVKKEQNSLWASNRQTFFKDQRANNCLLYTSPSPRDKRQSRMPSSA